MADTLRSRSSGRFWLDDPDRTVGGWIDLSRRWPVVDLAEPLTPSRREVARIERTDGSSEVHLEPADDPVEPDRVTVRGLLRSTVQGARRLTLVNAFNTGRGEVWGGVVPDPGSEQLTADYALLGDHTLDASSRFNRARVRLRNLDVWAQLPGIAMELNRDEGRVTVTYERPDEETVDLAGPPGGRLVLGSVLTVRMLTVRGGGPLRTTELRWETDGDGLTVDELWAQLIDPLRVLFSLTSGALDPVVELQVAELEGSWLKVLHPAPGDVPGRAFGLA
jgi:ApeA-like protein